MRPKIIEKTLVEKEVFGTGKAMAVPRWLVDGGLFDVFWDVI